MRHHFAAARNTCFALISSIERDLRSIIIEQCHVHEIPDLLPTDLRERAVSRWHADQHPASAIPPETDSDLLDYVDIADLDAILRRAVRPSLPALRHAAGEIRTDLDRLTPIRNRVCHARPLEDGDLPECLDVASRFASKSELPFNTLRHTRQLLASNPRFVLGVEIPSFWADNRTRIHHNLPLPEFDDTGFLGRRHDRRELHKLLLSHFPVVTVIGEGGIGKTALALQCLYDLLDEDESPYDAIVWSSLKMTALTASGVVQLRNDVASTLNLLGSLADALGSPDATKLNEARLHKELSDYMKEFRVLLAIDNLETLADARLRTLILSIPSGSKLLITSRVGIGEFETRYRLESLDSKTSVHLMRRVAQVLGESVVAKASDKWLRHYSDQLFGNPLLLKWFVSAVSRGADPASLLRSHDTPFRDALRFCFESVFDNLTSIEHRLVNTLVCSRRPLTTAEIFFLISDYPKTEIEWALASLHTSSVVRRSEVRNETVQYQVSAPASSYVSSNRAPSSVFFSAIQERMREMQETAGRRSKWKTRKEYEIFSVRPKSDDERIAALPLCQALDFVEAGKLKDARLKVEEAKRLLPTFAEAYRISGLVESKSEELYVAANEFQRAVECDSTSTIVRYTYAQFSLKYLKNSDLALEHVEVALHHDAGDPTLLSTKALILSRMERFSEAASIYESLIHEIGERPKRWRITTHDQAADCYRYWSRVDSRDRDRRAFSKHIGRALRGLAIAVESEDYDETTFRKVGMTLAEGALGARRFGDDELIGELVGLVERIASSVPGHRIPLTNPSKIAGALTGHVDLLERVQAVSSVAIPGTQTESATSDRKPSNQGTNGPSQMGRVEQYWPDRMYGFIRDGRGDKWFFHCSELVEAGMEPVLRPGLKVKFRLGTNAQGKCAVSVSTDRPKDGA